jgi:chemotaxis signal transduction protein
MLRDVIGGLPGAAAFVGAEGQLIAATDGALAGSLGAGFVGASGIVSHEGVHYACARVKAPGYREFKQGDRYDNGVEVVVGIRLGTNADCHASVEAADLQPMACTGGTPTTEVAVFDVGGTLYALPAREVVDAISTRGLARMPGAGGAALGLVEVGSGATARVVPVVCARRLFGVPERDAAAESLLIVLRSTTDKDTPVFALQVDDVTTVLDAAHEHVHPTPEGMAAFAPWVVSVIDTELVTHTQRRPALVQLLDCARLLAVIHDTGQPTGDDTDAGTRLESAEAGSDA